MNCNDKNSPQKNRKNSTQKITQCDTTNNSTKNKLWRRFQYLPINSAANVNDSCANIITKK